VKQIILGDFYKIQDEKLKKRNKFFGIGKKYWNLETCRKSWKISRIVHLVSLYISYEFEFIYQ
jgi:hypothetical protein